MLMDYRNCWLSPAGVIHPCRVFGHMSCAQEILEHEGVDLYELLEDEEWVKTHPFIDDPVEYLMSQGWIRYESLRTTDIGHWIICEKPKPTSAQLDKIYETSGVLYVEGEYHDRVVIIWKTF